MAHIFTEQQLLAQRQELDRQLQAQQLQPHEYRQALRRLEAEQAPPPRYCANGDSRQAHVILNDRPLCAACALMLKRSRA